MIQDPTVVDLTLLAELHQELKVIGSQDPRQIILCGDPEAAQALLKVLAVNSWLSSGFLEDAAGRPLDVLASLLNPRVMGDLAHAYRSGKLFAVVKKSGSISDLVVLDQSIKLQLDGDNSSHRLRLFVRDIGWVTLNEKRVRHMQCPDPKFASGQP